MGFDPISGNVFVYPDFDTVIYEFTPAGAEVLPTIPRPGNSSNDFDLDFLPEATTIGGVSVPANSLLVLNGDDSPDKLHAINKDTGTVLATVNIAAAGLHVGGSYHQGRQSLFIVNTADTISEINPATGAVLNSFPVAPTGSPAFGVNFGDVEVNQTTGNLFVVSDQQTRIRELTPTGEFVQDIDLGDLVSGMSGIAIDDTTGNIFLSSTNDCVYRLRQVEFGVHSFDAGLGTLVGVGFDPASGNVFVYPDFDTVIHEFTPTGAEVLPTIPPPGNSSNDFDLDFLPEATTIGGISVPANSLLVINGDDSPDTISALQKGDGTVLATVNIAAAGLHVGGSYSRGGRASLW